MVEIEGIDIVSLIKTGDKKAFEELFKKYYTPLCRFAISFTKDEMAAEEIVQEVFVTIWEQRDKLAIHTSIKSYLYMATRNRALNYLKSQNIQSAYKEEISACSTEGENSTDNLMNHEELQTLITKAINSLPEKCRAIFNLSRNDELSYKEIAEYLDISIKTVENQMGIALKKLRVQLRPYVDKAIIIAISVMYLFN